MRIIISIITLVLSTFGFSQVFGCLIFKLFKKRQFQFIISIILWGLILIGYYFVIKIWFNSYFNYYLYPTIIGAFLALLNIKEE